MQLDFFNDSQNVSLRNDVIFALEQCNVPLAQQAWEKLGQHCPDDTRQVASLLLLIVFLAARSQVPFQSHADLYAARLELQNKITPAAQGSLGSAAAAVWLRERWQELTKRAALLPFHAEHADDHAATLWLHIANWQMAADAVTQIESWRRIPAPLSWMLQARLRLQGLQANWGLLAELAWLSPNRLGNVVRQAADPILQQWVTKFEQGFVDAGDASDLVWLPAWLLTQRPALAPHLAQAQASQHSQPEQAMRVLLEMLGLERQGRQREVVEHRKTLRGLHSGLYAAYLATR